jgi:hypothetical protein
MPEGVGRAEKGRALRTSQDEMSRPAWVRRTGIKEGMRRRAADHPGRYGAEYRTDSACTELRVRTRCANNTDGLHRSSSYTPSVEPDAVPIESIAPDLAAGVASLNLPDDSRAPATPSARDAAPVRDARRISERIARDEALADEARQRYRSGGLPHLEPSGLAELLVPGERLHAVHRMAMLEVGWRHTTGSDPELPRGGTLYITSGRLVHRGVHDGIWNFAEIDEMAVALERLLRVRLRDGSDIAIEVDQPRLLRVELAAALAASRNKDSAQS